MRSEFRLLTVAVAGLLAGPLAPAHARTYLTDELATKLQGAAGAGRMGRLWQDWILRPIESIDKEVLRDLRRARRAARELAGTWGPASRWVRLAEEQIAGAQGVRLRVQLTTRKNGKEVSDLERNRRIERAWYRWGRPDLCDVARRLSFQAHERLFVKTWARDGEAVLRMVEGFPNASRFALQALDPDQLDDTLNVPAGRGQNEIRGGVEVDAWGAPVAYHLFTAHPNDLWATSARERIPAEQVLHWYEIQRAGQSRGLPRLLSALVAAKYTSGYEEAEVTAARSAAIRMGFYKRDPTAASIPDPRNAPTGDDGSRIFWEGEPGQFGLLPTGWSVEDWSPNHPSSQYAAFIKSMLRSIASGLAIGYNTLANDLEGVNFSSLRSGTLAERDRYQVDQQDLIAAMHARIFPRWITWAVTVGHLPPEDLEAADPERHTWQARGWPWVDPLKDVQTDILAIRAGLSSRTRAAAARGIDHEEVFLELAAEKALANDLGLDLDTDLGGRPIDAAGGAPDVAAGEG